MRLSEPVCGAAFGLRSPQEEDAAFTVALRSDPETSRFLHRIPGDVAAQLRWQELAIASDDDLPLVIFRTSTGGAVGTAGIYHVDKQRRTAEWGRWVVARSSLAAVESVLLILRVAFDQLSLDTLYARTLRGNRRVVSFHDSAGFTRVGEGQIDVDGVAEPYVEHAVCASDMARLQRRFEPLVERVAGHAS